MRCGRRSRATRISNNLSLLYRLTLLNNPQLQSREDLRRALGQLQNYPGVTGATGFDFIGEADKILFLLQVQNGTIVQIN